MTAVLFRGLLSRLESQEMSCTERRVPALGKKLHHRNGHAHLGDIGECQPHTVPDFHHDSFFHHQIHQIGLAGELRAQMHFAHNTPWGADICGSGAKGLACGGSQQSSLLTSIYHSKASSRKSCDPTWPLYRGSLVPMMIKESLVPNEFERRRRGMSAPRAEGRGDIRNEDKPRKGDTELVSLDPSTASSRHSGNPALPSPQCGTSHASATPCPRRSSLAEQFPTRLWNPMESWWSPASCASCHIFRR